MSVAVVRHISYSRQYGQRALYFTFLNNFETIEIIGAYDAYRYSLDSFAMTIADPAKSSHSYFAMQNKTKTKIGR